MVNSFVFFSDIPHVILGTYSILKYIFFLYPLTGNLSNTPIWEMLVLRNLHILKDLLFVSEMQMQLGILYSHLLPGGTSGKDSVCQRTRHKRGGFDPWAGKIPWTRKPQPTPVFLPGEFKDRGTWRATVHRAAKSGTLRSTCTHTALAGNLSYHLLGLTNWLSNSVQVKLCFPILKLLYLNIFFPFLLTSYVQTHDKL